MIYHMLCLLMVVMMFNSVISAPGQMNAINDIARARKNKSRPSSYGTLDPLGGGHLLRADSPFTEVQNYKSYVNYQEDVARENKPSSRPLSSGTLDPLGGGNLLRAATFNANDESLRLKKSSVDNQNMMRLAREDKSIQRSLHALDNLGGGRITGLVDPSKGQVFRSLDRSHLVDTLEQGGDVIRMLDSISGSELLSSLDSAEGMAVLSALMKSHNKHPKRMLDSVSGWSFGESKRNFDEIDNVGFTGFAKRSPHRSKQLALAKKNFDEIDRAGFETYNKRDFDEIDRAGFETFEKRDRKE